MGEILVVQSKVKDLAKKAGLRTGADFVRVLSKKVEEITRPKRKRISYPTVKKVLDNHYEEARP